MLVINQLKKKYYTTLKINKKKLIHAKPNVSKVNVYKSCYHYQEVPTNQVTIVWNFFIGQGISIMSGMTLFSSEEEAMKAAHQFQSKRSTTYPIIVKAFVDSKYLRKPGVHYKAFGNFTIPKDQIVLYRVRKNSGWTGGVNPNIGTGFI